MKVNEYRTLLSTEIQQLESQGCTAEDWSQIHVTTDFRPERVKEVRFSGRIRLGAFHSEFHLPGGISKPSGIYRATLHNVTVGAGCRIAEVGDYISNYHIDQGVRIEHIGCLGVEESTTFGNGTLVAVLNEAGGREVCMHETLSAQVAYLQCHYRQDEVLQQQLKQINEKYCSSLFHTKGFIGAYSTLTHCKTLKNIKTGEWAVLEGVEELTEGTVCSTRESPTYLGTGIIAHQFIFKTGVKIVDHSHLTRCFVGEASYIGRGFTATDCLIFCNCHFENGEACALFAGPFTVSHHKSTLLIGMMASFMNAGSGTNQSNHAYKLGPIHYGILERGCRTGSGSYLLWPSRIGAFSTVIGSVKSHINSSCFPFSYVIGENHKVYLAPGATLRSIGTWRDAEKWPWRDGRKNPVPADVVHLEILSPYTIGRMQEAVYILRQIQKGKTERNGEFLYQGMWIRRSSLERGLRLYEQALYFWAGNQLLELTCQDSSSEKNSLFEEGLHRYPGKIRWIDIAGMYITGEVLEYILTPLRSGEIQSPHELNETFRRAADDFRLWSASSVGVLLQRILGPLREISDLMQAITLWKEKSLELFESVLEDGKKEFAPEMQLSSGIDCTDEAERTKDFEIAGGQALHHPFLKTIRDRMDQIRQQADTFCKK